MKLHSSFPTPQKSSPAPRPRRTGLRRRFTRFFTTGTAWWIFAVIVTVFAITIMRSLRHLYESVQP